MERYFLQNSLIMTSISQQELVQLSLDVCFCCNISVMTWIFLYFCMMWELCWSHCYHSCTQGMPDKPPTADVAGLILRAASRFALRREKPQPNRANINHFLIIFRNILGTAGSSAGSSARRCWYPLGRKTSQLQHCVTASVDNDFGHHHSVGRGWWWLFWLFFGLGLFFFHL